MTKGTNGSTPNSRAAAHSAPPTRRQRPVGRCPSGNSHSTPATRTRPLAQVDWSAMASLPSGRVPLMEPVIQDRVGDRALLEREQDAAAEQQPAERVAGPADGHQHADRHRRQQRHQSHQLGRRLVRKRDQHQGGDVEDQGEDTQGYGQPGRKQPAAETTRRSSPTMRSHDTGRPFRHRYGQILYAERAVVPAYSEMFSTTVTV